MGKKSTHCPEGHPRTGKVRGLLCNAHNTAIGILGDTPEHLQKALEYLLKAVED
jgi:hypothetical protein